MHLNLVSLYVFLFFLVGCERKDVADVDNYWLQSSFTPSSLQEVVGQYKSSNISSRRELELYLDSTFQERRWTDTWSVSNCVKWKGTYISKADSIQLTYETAEFLEAKCYSFTIAQAKERLENELKSLNDYGALYFKHAHNLKLLVWSMEKDRFFAMVSKLENDSTRAVQSLGLFLVKEMPDSTTLHSSL
jgi:hypothetical protein